MKCFALAALAIGLLVLPAAPAHASLSIGSRSVGAAEAGCATPTAHTAVACTFSQASLRGDRVASGGLRSPINGVVVSWALELRYSDSVADARAKLRILQDNFGDGSSAEQVLPLVTGTYLFPTRMPIFTGGRLGVDITMTSGVIGGSVDVLSPETAVGTAEKWVPSLGDGLTLAPTETLPDKELLLGAQVEADADEDGYGDETQDRCPTDKTLQGKCGPRISLTGSKKQKLGKSVVVEAACNEACSVTGSGKIATSGGRASKNFKLTGATKSLAANVKGTIKLKLSRSKRTQIKRVLARNGKATAKVKVVAKGASGDVADATYKIKLRR